MEINFAGSFFESLEKLIKKERWYNRLFDTIRYDIPRFCKNFWLFRKDLWNYYWYDWSGSARFMRTALDDMQKNTNERGNEIRSSADKKIYKMRRAVYLLNVAIEDTYIELAEKELGPIIHHPLEFEPVPDNPGFSRLIDKNTPEEEEHNSKVFKRSREIEKEMNVELWQILKGQDYDDFKGSGDEDWDKFFDGSGLKTWWD